MLKLDAQITDKEWYYQKYAKTIFPVSKSVVFIFHILDGHIIILKQEQDKKKAYKSSCFNILSWKSSDHNIQICNLVTMEKHVHTHRHKKGPLNTSQYSLPPSSSAFSCITSAIVPTIWSAITSSVPLMNSSVIGFLAPEKRLVIGSVRAVSWAEMEGTNTH